MAEIVGMNTSPTQIVDNQHHSPTLELSTEYPSHVWLKTATRDYLFRVERNNQPLNDSEIKTEFGGGGTCTDRAQVDRFIDRFVATPNVEKSDINRELKKISSTEGVFYQSPDPEVLVERVCHVFDTNDETKYLGQTVAGVIDDVGKHPAIIASTATWLASYTTTDSLNQSQFADEFDVCEVSIRNTRDDITWDHNAINDELTTTITDDGMLPVPDILSEHTNLSELYIEYPGAISNAEIGDREVLAVSDTPSEKTPTQINDEIPITAGIDTTATIENYQLRWDYNKSAGTVGLTVFEQ
jgi:hypothetical protein